MKATRFRVGATLVVALVCMLLGVSVASATPSPPTLAVETAPPDPVPGNALTITAIVTPGTDPTSTDLSVNCDLSWVQLGPSSPLYDDGTNGDVTAGDLIFTKQVTIPPETIPGMRIGSCTVFDAQDRTSSADYFVNVVSGEVNAPPTVSAGGPYTVNEGDSIALAATGSDPEGGPLTYAWDLDNDGTFETLGQAATFDASALDGPGAQTVVVQVTDDAGQIATDSTQVTIVNVAPTATFNAPASSPAGFPFTLSLSSPHDPSAADTSAGFTYAFDCGGGYGAFGSSSSSSCPTTDTGVRPVGGKIRDKDGGVTEYRGTVRVFVTFSSLCDLVRASSTDPKVADDLCHKLAQAGAAPNDNARDGLLGAFRNQVDAKTGKGLAPAQAAELKLLSTRL